MMSWTNYIEKYGYKEDYSIRGTIILKWNKN